MEHKAKCSANVEEEDEEIEGEVNSSVNRQKNLEGGGGGCTEKGGGGTNLVYRNRIF